MRRPFGIWLLTIAVLSVSLMVAWHLIFYYFNPYARHAYVSPWQSGTAIPTILVMALAVASVLSIHFRSSRGRVGVVLVLVVINCVCLFVAIDAVRFFYEAYPETPMKAYVWLRIAAIVIAPLAVAAALICYLYGPRTRPYFTNEKQHSPPVA